jgi:hypothetical protein
VVLVEDVALVVVDWSVVVLTEVVVLVELVELDEVRHVEAVAFDVGRAQANQIPRIPWPFVSPAAVSPM